MSFSNAHNHLCLVALHFFDRLKVYVFPVNNKADDWSTDRLYCKSAYFTYGDKVYIAKQIIIINEKQDLIIHSS